MAPTKLVIDPITRIEGHLRIEVQAEAGRVTNAWASGTMFRGLELVMQGRDPRDSWAFMQRICGVCTLVHAVAACRAVEDALDVRIPPNAVQIRNLMHGMQYLQDHVMHFYHLHALDWVDVVSAAKANADEAARIAQQLSPWPNNSASRFREVQRQLTRFVSSGQLGIFANGYWGHPAYKLPPEVNLIAVSHYLEGLDWQRDVIRLHTVFGGKNPHPHFTVGGMSCAINLSDAQTINAESLSLVRGTIDRAQAFVEQVYWPDLLAIAGYYKEWAGIGGGVRDFLAVGEFPEGDVTDLRSLYFPRGIVLGGDLSRVHDYDPTKVAEYIHSSWYEYEGGSEKGLHPYEGQSKPRYTGPKPPYEYLQDQQDGKYTWMKAPRYDGRPMQVGPLARMLVAYAAGHQDARALTKEVMDRLGVGPAALFSTLGRVAARGMETMLIARRMDRWYDMLVNRIKSGDVSTYNAKAWDPAGWPKQARGYGFLDAPRGALGHWVVIEDGKVKNYQCVVPTTWNCSPRDAKGQPGPYEAALLDNHPLLDPKRPLEILRTIHSFDPCMACGVHVLDAAGEPVLKVRVE